jgi:hypothetical protein
MDAIGQARVASDSQVVKRADVSNVAGDRKPLISNKLLSSAAEFVSVSR